MNHPSPCPVHHPSLHRRDSGTRGLVAPMRGQSLVEFAILGTALLFLLFGILEGGRAFTVWLAITNEAREGARWGAVRATAPGYDTDPALFQADLQSRVQSRLPSLSFRKSTTPCVVSSVLSSGKTALTVNISCQMGYFIPLVGKLLPGSLTAESVMRVEQ